MGVVKIVSYLCPNGASNRQFLVVLCYFLVVVSLEVEGIVRIFANSVSFQKSYQNHTIIVDWHFTCKRIFQ